MIKINRHHSVQGLMSATALALGSLAEGAAPAHAGVVTVTGANGANGYGYYLAGAGYRATATTTTPSDASNTATATGGNGGSVPFCSIPSECIGGPGGNGGSANSTATTLIGSGARSAEATSFGGSGGNGKGWSIPAPGGKGGAASSSASASSTGSASATANSTGGHGGRYYLGNGGAASSSASASSTTGSASATANSTGGAGIGASGGAATASANARNSYGAALTSASAPAGSSAIAVTKAAVEAVGSGSATLIPIVEGQSASVVRLVPGASNFATGAMSAGTSGGTASSVIDFSLKSPENVYLDLLGYNVLGAGFSSLQLTISASDHFDTTYQFLTLASAEKFFTNDKLDLGSFAGVSQSIDMSYLLTASGGATGFGFNFNVDPPLAPATFPSRRPGRCCSSASPASPSPVTGRASSRARQRL